jgi:CBS domain-containing protein
MDDERLSLFSSAKYVMNGPPVFVRITDALQAVAEVMSREGVGAAIVRGPRGPEGIITERDIVEALAEGAKADDVWASDIASLDLVTVEPNATVRDVIRKMAEYGIRHVPVTADGEVLGMVSARDILAWLEG